MRTRRPGWACRRSTASGRSAATTTRRRSTSTSSSIVPRTALFAGLLLAVARDPASWRRGDAAASARAPGGASRRAARGRRRPATAGRSSSAIRAWSPARPMPARTAASLHPGDAARPGARVLGDHRAALAEAGFSLGDVVRTRMYVVSIDDVAGGRGRPRRAVRRRSGRRRRSSRSPGLMDPTLLVEIEAEARRAELATARLSRGRRAGRRSRSRPPPRGRGTGCGARRRRPRQAPTASHSSPTWKRRPGVGRHDHDGDGGERGQDGRADELEVVERPPRQPIHAGRQQPERPRRVGHERT